MTKTPTDHKPKKPTVTDVDGGKQVTFDGITVVVVADALDDFELLDELHQFEVKNNATFVPSIVRRLVGDDDTDRIIEHLRDKTTGRVRVTRVAEFLKELFGALNPSS